jgi:4-hydroxy-2-oxoheptanedioate aldolase
MERAISYWRVLAILFVGVAAVAALAGAPKATRINRAIDLLAQGQPVYYTGSHEGTDGNFEQGVKDAQTWADYISYDMEHAPFDVKGLADEATVRANAWMFQQVLATGVHGVLLCHADAPGAVRAFVEAVRFPAFGGRRGVHGNTTAARIWGITPDEYAEKADAWPLNPNGELLLGLKLEDKYALENAEANAKVPGIGFAEWGPGDMAFSLGVKNAGSGTLPPAMQAARQRVFNATKASKIFFLNSVNADNVVDMITEGVMIGAANERAAEVGRRHTKREMPW